MDTGRVIRLDGKFDKGKIQVIKLWADRDRIGNPKLVKAMLQDLVRAIGMTPHGPPHVFTYPTPELGFTADQGLGLPMQPYSWWKELWSRMKTAVKVLAGFNGGLACMAGVAPLAIRAIQCLHESYVVYDNWIEYTPAFAVVDINSCRVYNTDKAVECLVYWFKPVAINVAPPVEYTWQVTERDREVLRFYDRLLRKKCLGSAYTEGKDINSGRKEVA